MRFSAGLPLCLVLPVDALVLSARGHASWLEQVTSAVGGRAVVVPTVLAHLVQEAVRVPLRTRGGEVGGMGWDAVWV